MSRQCKQLKNDGTPCKAPAMHGGDLCPFHDPASRAKALSKREEKKVAVSKNLELTMIDIVEAIESDDYFRPLLMADGGDVKSWKNWIVCLKAIFALEMDNEEKRIYSEFTGNSEIPKKLLKEVYLIIGRRGGKSFISALIAVYLALFKDWSMCLKAGEMGWIFVVASDRHQARVVQNYIGHMLNKQFPEKVEKELKESIYLTNNITIEIRTSSWRGVRGYTIVAVICDELAFWRGEDGANPGKEIIRALRPGMITVPESMLIAISTPYAKSGVLWDVYDKKYGTNDEHVMVWKAPTDAMNPTINKEEIKRAYENDPIAAAAEWGAEFRSSITSPFDPEDIKAVRVEGRRLLLPNSEIHYKAFVDPSAGKVDSFTLGIAHQEHEKIILDRLEEIQAPCDPKVATKEFCEILKEYKCYQVIGDKFAGNWCSNEFRDNGIKYIDVDKSKSEIYLIFQTLVLSRLVELLDNIRMTGQFQNLERRPHVGGRDTIDHPRKLKDDMANAAAGVCVIIYKDIHLKLGPEYMAQRLPTTTYSGPLNINSPHEQQRNRVLQKLRDEGVI